MSQEQCCATCLHYKRVDARATAMTAGYVMDPSAIYMLCTWTPAQPFWMPPPYLADGPVPSLAAQREPTDGVTCPVYNARPGSLGAA